MATHLPTSKLPLLGLALALGLAGAVACGPSGSGSLLGDDFGNGNGSGGDGGSDWGNGGGGPTYNAEGGVTPVQVKLWQALEKDFLTKCGSCHANGTGGVTSQTFLKGPDVYGTVKAYPGVILPDDVYGSKLLSRPANHPVASLVDPGNEALLAQITAWLSAEVVAIKSTPLPTTDVIDPMSGSIDLTKAGLAGAKIVFNPSVSGTSLRLNDVRLQAPATSGVHIQAPIFVVVPAKGAETTNTTFSTTDLTVPAGGTATIGPVMYFFGFPTGSKVRIQFQKIESATGGAADAGSQSSCKALTDFTNTARPALQAACANCHGGNNANAQAALDMSKLQSDPASACTQALFKVNTGNKANSNILLAPLTGSGLNHPVKPFANTGAAGYQSILTWVNKE